jgi:hypothetical protein
MSGTLTPKVHSVERADSPLPMIDPPLRSGRRTDGEVNRPALQHTSPWRRLRLRCSSPGSSRSL